MKEVENLNIGCNH